MFLKKKKKPYLYIYLQNIILTITYDLSRATYKSYLLTSRVGSKYFFSCARVRIYLDAHKVNCAFRILACKAYRKSKLHHMKHV